MPDTNNHTHPLYEDTFKRIATILDVIAEEQQEQARQIAEQARWAAEQAREAAARGAAIDARIEALAAALADYIEHGRIRDAETTDKLNGLIDLMDRRMREHRERGL